MIKELISKIIEIIPPEEKNKEDFKKGIYNFYKIFNGSARQPMEVPFPIEKPTVGYALTSMSKNPNFYNAGNRRTTYFNLLVHMYYLEFLLGEDKSEPVDKEAFRENCENNFDEMFLKEFTYFATNENKFYAFASLEHSILYKQVSNTLKYLKGGNSIFDKLNKILTANKTARENRMEELEQKEFRFNKIIEQLEKYNTPIETFLVPMKEVLEERIENGEFLNKQDITKFKTLYSNAIKSEIEKKIARILLNHLTIENFEKSLKFRPKSFLTNQIINNSSMNIDIHFNGTQHIMYNKIPDNKFSSEERVIYTLDKIIHSEDKNKLYFIFYKTFLNKETLDKLINTLEIFVKTKEKSEVLLNNKIKNQVKKIANYLRESLSAYKEDFLAEYYNEDTLKDIRLNPEVLISVIIEQNKLSEELINILNSKEVQNLFIKEIGESL